MSETASFGYREVPAEAKAGLVKDLFTQVAGRYDLMNDLMSLGIHRLWKAEMVEWLRPRPGWRAVDVAGGTGDIARAMLDAGVAGVTVVDLTPAMLIEGRAKTVDAGRLGGIDWVAGNAEALPLPDRAFDAYTVAFGLRNVTHLDQALAEAARVLKPGGRFLALEFAPRAAAGLNDLYDLYSFSVLPWLGEKVAGDRDAYVYLAESIRRFPDPEGLARMIRAAGFGGHRHRSLSCGIAQLHGATRLLMLRAVRHLLRLAGIARILARHDAFFFADQVPNLPATVRLAVRLFHRRAPGRPGQRLAQALAALGPSFIKLGQALATRSDLLGEEVADDLAELQDRLPPFPAEVARATVAAELGSPVETMFSTFEETPVAAASIAQVHFAVTTEGREVAVKILRPGIEAAFARDLDLLRWIAEWVESVMPSLRRLKPIEIVDTFADTVRMEMDLRLEGAAAAELKENFEGDPDFRVPAVDWARTARRVLVIERVAGVRIDDVAALTAAGHDPDVILAKSAQAFFRQVFRDGFFHADMHPGNMFVTSDGALAPVDFGIMGRLERPTRIFLAEMLRGFLTGDYREVALVHFRAGYVPKHKSLDAFAQACRSIGEPLMGKPLNEISVGRLLAQLFRVTETFEMETQPQLLLLQKTMVVAEGVGRKLNPTVNMWQLAEPLIAEWMRENRGPEARIGEAASDLMRAIERLPRLLAEAETAATSLVDGVRLHPETVKQLQGVAARPTGAHRALWAAVVLLAAAVAALALAR